MAEVRVSREQLPEAVEALDRILDAENETCRSLQVAWRLRGETHAQLGHREEAIHDLERCVELSSDTEDGQACRRLLEGTAQP
jgi:regulator of sirC expression with transglutaminase-like and TPR domain